MIKSVMNVAFLGPRGSYSHIAATKYANYYFNQIKEHSCQKFSDIFSLVEKNQAKYGILPIENSNSGLIDEVCDLLLTTELILIKDITIPIQHHILANNNTSLEDIQIIYSHPQPIQQCKNFLKHFATWKIKFCASSAIAIKTVARLNQSNIAALGSLQGGIFYGLHSLLSLSQIISNFHINTTRFIILQHKTSVIIDNLTSKKIMIKISIDQQSNNFLLILNILKHYNIKINFLRLCAFLRNTSKSIIILEIISYINNFYMQKALIKIRKLSNSLQILGCYSSITNIEMNT